MIIVIFVVLVCFGLTVYGIVYLTGKIFGSEERAPSVETQKPPVGTNPEDGDVIVYTDNGTPFIPGLEEPVIDTGTDIPGITDEKYPNVEIKPPAAGTPPPAEEITPKPAVVAKPKPAVTPKPNPKAKQEPKAQAASKPLATPAAVRGEYAVQIMAVKSKTAADKEALKYKGACPDVFVQKADLGAKGVWYRIRCGLSDTKTEAEAVKKELALKFGVSPTVVPNK